ncbi:MAG: efflux RND transporter periplasmic adaptor subunit [Lentisphaerae bacterium]|nr:efflux RND transporter periplasmic adaptor subunit [Lentisphaerota bacterium]
MKKIFALIGILLLLGLGGLIVFRLIEKTRPVEEQKSSSAAPVTVLLAEVKRGDVADIGNFTGSLEADSLFNISPKTAGRLKTLNYNIGDVVTLNDLVAVLDDEEQQQAVNEQSAALVVCEAEVKSALANVMNAKAGILSAETEVKAAESGVKSAEAQQVLAKRELDRHTQLRKEDLNTQAELDSAKATYEVQLSEVDIARSKVEIATTGVAIAKTKLAIAETQVAIAESQVVKQKAALEAARARLGYTRITAAWEGGSDKRLVAQRFVDPGAMLSVNSPIICVVDISKMRAIVSTVEKDYARLKLGQSARVFVDAYRQGAPGSKEPYFSGKIVRIAPVITEVARQGRVEIEIDNPSGYLKPGMFARIEIEFDRHKDCYLVPSEAIVRRDDVTGMFFSVGNEPEMTVEFVPIVTGIRYGQIVEVSPVKPEQESFFNGRIVTMGNHLLRQGSLIRLPVRR